MHDSLTPLGGMVPLINIMLGEIIFGGVGSGLYGMLLFAILSVFIAGLMVGRTPEYLGKKIEAKEMKMAMLAILILPLLDPWLHGHRHGCPRTVLPAWPTPARMASPRSFMPTLRRPATTAAPSRGSPPTPCSTTPRWHRDADRALPHGHPGTRHRRALWPRKKILPPSAGTFPTDTRCFMLCLSASS